LMMETTRTMVNRASGLQQVKKRRSTNDGTRISNDD